MSTLLEERSPLTAALPEDTTLLGLATLGKTNPIFEYAEFSFGQFAGPMWVELQLNQV